MPIVNGFQEKIHGDFNMTIYVSPSGKTYMAEIRASGNPQTKKHIDNCTSLGDAIAKATDWIDTVPHLAKCIAWCSRYIEQVKKIAIHTPEVEKALLSLQEAQSTLTGIGSSEKLTPKEMERGIF